MLWEGWAGWTLEGRGLGGQGAETPGDTSEAQEN